MSHIDHEERLSSEPGSPLQKRKESSILAWIKDHQKERNCISPPEVRDLARSLHERCTGLKRGLGESGGASASNGI
jgi:hypothetical protein